MWPAWSACHGPCARHIGHQGRDPRGRRTIEHASLADDEAFALAKQHGTWFSMDIHNDHYILAEGEKNGVFAESLAKEKEIGLKQRQTFRAEVKAGVKIVFTDGGVIPRGDNAKQLATMVTWGMTPLQAIRAATVNAAHALSRSDDVGTIATGRYGDLVGIRGDPLADIHRLEAPAFVMKGGVVVKALSFPDRSAGRRIICRVPDGACSRWRHRRLRRCRSRWTSARHDVRMADRSHRPAASLLDDRGC